MSENEVASQQVVLQQEAQAQQTKALLSKGWIALIVCWLAPVIPLVGFLPFFLAFPVAGIIGGIAIARNQVGGGIALILAGLVGTVVGIFIWMAIYAFAAATLGMGGSRHGLF